MRLPGRISAAIEVLGDIETRKRPASAALRDWGLAHRFAGSGDRAAIGNLVYDVLRRRASHAFAMGDAAPRALVLSVVVRDWRIAADALQADLATDRFAPAPLSEAELGHLTANDPLAAAPDTILADLPEKLVPAFAAGLGDDWVAEGQALGARPPLDLRVNTLKSTREKALKALARFKPAPTGIAPAGIRLAPGAGPARTPNVQTDAAFLKGWVEIQDEGSQLVSALIDARPGHQVLDFCAGAGGKTLALAAAMNNKGQLFAHDAARNRLAPIYDRLKRNGVRNVQVRPPDPGALDDLRDRMDKVVVDAPCTGSGTWRRRPDAKWRLTRAQLETRLQEQRAILADAAKFVKPGGDLVYITCSLLPGENQNQIVSFLGQHPEFKTVSAMQRWQELVCAAPLPHTTKEGHVTLTPHKTGTDGFFCAILRRLG